MWAEGGKHRASAHDRGFQCLRAGGCEVGGDDPRRASGQDVRGELSGVAGHRGDVVAGVQGLAQDLRPTPPVAAMIMSFMVSFRFIG